MVFSNHNLIRMYLESEMNGEALFVFFLLVKLCLAKLIHAKSLIKQRLYIPDIILVSAIPYERHTV